MSATDHLVVPAVFKRVHDYVVNFSMQTDVSDISKSVLTELECPVCKEYMVPPITFCLGGHNICNNCIQTVSSCRTCKQKFLKTKNVSLENLSLQMKFPCRYNKYGCKDTSPYNVFLEHKAICGYSPQKCPVLYLRLKMICTWTGIYKDVKEHLQTAHKDLCEDYNAEHSHFLLASKAPIWPCKFLFAYNEIFCYRLLDHHETICLCLYYIGPAENDSKYQYKVMVKNNQDAERVVVTHLVRSFTENEDGVLFLKNCLKLHRDLTERFRNEKGELAVLLKILRVGDWLLHDD